MASSLLTEDQLLCSICLDVFTLPVTLPCGHNFCRKCISHHWDVNVPCHCPMCKERFDARPNLRTNIFISEMAARFRQSAGAVGSHCAAPRDQIYANVRPMALTEEPNMWRETGAPGGSPRRPGENMQTPHRKAGTTSCEATGRSTRPLCRPKPQVAKLGDVSCDECSGIKLKALKSCLACLTSYCETHLKPHLTSLGLKRHQLVDPVKNLEDRMCPTHDKPLELFCRTDHTSVCVLCTVLDHKSHMFVPLKDEHGMRKAMLEKTEGKMCQMIQERRRKIQEVTLSAKLNREAADRGMAGGVQVFTDLMQFLEGGLTELIETIEEKLKAMERKAGGVITELEQEINVLTKRRTEVEQLSCSDDHFHLVQGFSALNTAPPTKDWTEVSVCQPLYEELVRRAVVGAVDRLQETFRKEKKKLLEAELKRVQKYEVEVTLDPQTASPWLILSGDVKQVSLGDTKKTLPDKPERFYPGGGVLGKQSFSSGRFYYEVRVKEKTKWDFGVVKESINRKGKITKSHDSGFWILSARKGNEYKARGGHDVPLSPTRRPERVGVFVDYEEGLVSFYDANVADLIFSFTDCRFTERLYPFFRPSHTRVDSAPLIISPVNHTN
ncbi:zinc-binding protein A33-like [Micropterus salmoides]|uniref:zinc-binding protein A33-like n=1 Tax=Micropterus salmoides TaxID=27706 RepID=UPI0018ECB928|nr:zinc-binding protein A33-like [Micropterus salmoides]